MMALPEIDDTDPPMGASAETLRLWLRNLRKRPKTLHVRQSIEWALERIAQREAIEAAEVEGKI